MRFLLSIVAIFSTINISCAQSFIIVPNDTIYMVGMLEDLETLSIQQQNVSSDTITLKWQKVSASVPLLWDAWVCDNSFCNTSLVDSGTMIPVLPADYGLLLLHITPHVNFGTATIRYAVWDSLYPTLKDTLTYILTVNATSILTPNENKNTFAIFPNPAEENINIKFGDNQLQQFEILNSIGEKIYAGSCYTNHLLPIADWPNGLYTITSFSENKELISKNFLVQH